MVFLVWLSVPVPNGKRRKFNDIARGTERNWKKDAWLDLATRRPFDRMSELRLLKGTQNDKRRKTRIAEIAACGAEITEGRKKGKRQ